MYRLGFVILSVALTQPVQPAQAASPDPADLAIPATDLARARELVRQLGSGRFRDREDAQAALAALGRRARPALAEALATAADPEVRARAARLLPRADAADLRARVDTFLADADGKFQHDLPGWNAFRVAAGAERQVFGVPVASDQALDQAARHVFVDLLADPSNRQLLLAIGDTPAELERVVAARKQELYKGRFGGRGINGVAVTGRQPTAADLATLLFAESQAPGAPAVGGRFNPLSSLFFTPAANAAFTDAGDTGRVYRALVTTWADSRTDPAAMYQALSLTRSLDQRDASARLAARLLASPGATAMYRGQAAMALAQYGGPEHLAALTDAMTDTSTVMRFFQGGLGQQAATEVQLRDVALAAALLITHQDPAEYGFTERYRGSGGTIRYSYSNWTLAEDKRAAAFDKWKAFTARSSAGR